MSSVKILSHDGFIFFLVETDLAKLMWVGKSVSYPRRSRDFSEGIVIQVDPHSGEVTVRDFCGELWRGQLHLIRLLTPDIH